ncbi:high choriolytic enzyme 1-like [Chironomus tepperi]|uniref:high choriolytic enzyme 1-like n=1 Tax=Chironomus tepperi TaxID=113505 RepID=UPI00391FC6D5
MQSKILTIFLVAILSLAAGLPAYKDVIIYPDHDKIEEEFITDIEALKADRRNLIGDPNLLTAENSTAEYLIDSDANKALENGNFYQGDIIMEQEQMEWINSMKAKDGEPQSDEDDFLGTRTGLIWEGYRWPKNSLGSVIVPYVIDDRHYNVFDELKILFAMLDIEKFTCVQFVLRTNERNYIHIYSGDGCNSHLGRQGGRQLLSLKRNGCMSRGTILHELIHALGYDHMQNHYNRDSYVHILWDNILESEKSNFDIDNPFMFSNFGTPYDFYSVMHYAPYAFSKNKRPTIVPKDKYFNKIIGQRNALSSGDAERINNMYKCYT